MYIEMDIIQFLLISVMHYFVRKVWGHERGNQ
jgi:hypothetical protein